MDEAIEPSVSPPAPVEVPKPARRGRPQEVRAQTLRMRGAGNLVQLPVSYPDGVERPKTRGDCVDGPRPCPFVSCSHHLYLDVSPKTGSIKLNFPDLDVDELKETCALDVADRGGTILEEVGALMNLTRERVRQIEVNGGAKMAAELAVYVEDEGRSKRRDDDRDTEGVPDPDEEEAEDEA